MLLSAFLFHCLRLCFSTIESLNKLYLHFIVLVYASVALPRKILASQQQYFRHDNSKTPSPDLIYVLGFFG